MLAILVKKKGQFAGGHDRQDTDSFFGQESGFSPAHPRGDQEADPTTWLPTASTTAQMAMGDALATSLLALRGFTRGGFRSVSSGWVTGQTVVFEGL